VERPPPGQFVVTVGGNLAWRIPPAMTLSGGLAHVGPSWIGRARRTAPYSQFFTRNCWPSSPRWNATPGNENAQLNGCSTRNTMATGKPKEAMVLRLQTPTEGWVLQWCIRSVIWKHRCLRVGRARNWLDERQPHGGYGRC